MGGANKKKPGTEKVLVGTRLICCWKTSWKIRYVMYTLLRSSLLFKWLSPIPPTSHQTWVTRVVADRDPSSTGTWTHSDHNTVRSNAGLMFS